MKPVRLLCYMFLWTWRCSTFKTILSNLCNCVKKPEKNSGLHCDDHWLSLRSLRRSFLHFNFISAVHIWFISYVINTHFFQGNIWTHNWPAPNVSGFIAQLVEHRMNFFQASLRNCINCVHCDDHFFIFTLSIYPVPGIEPVDVPALQSSALATDLNLMNPTAGNVLIS